MIRRLQYRCSFKRGADITSTLTACKEKVQEYVNSGKLCNVSFYRHEDMGFLYVEEIVSSAEAPVIDIEQLMADMKTVLKTWPREEGDVFWAPMINVYYHHIPDTEKESEAIAAWMAVDPESHFDRVKARGENFLVIPCLFTVDRVDRQQK